MENIIFSNTMGSEGREKELNKLAKVMNETGLLTLVNSGGSVGITTTYTKLGVGGEENINETKGMYGYNSSLHRLEISKDGIYSIRLCGSVEFPANAELEISCFVNGVEYSPDAHPQVQGRGNSKPVMVSVVVSIPLKKGDYMEMMAKGDGTYTLAMKGNNLSIEKKIFG